MALSFSTGVPLAEVSLGGLPAAAGVRHGDWSGTKDVANGDCLGDDTPGDGLVGEPACFCGLFMRVLRFDGLTCITPLCLQSFW